LGFVYGSYFVDFDKIVDGLRRFSPRVVLIQSPLGLRGVAVEVAKRVKELGYEALLSNSSCWGACDVAYQEARSIGADAIIHLGHTPFLRRDEIPTIYVECPYHDAKPLIEMTPRIKNELSKFKRIGLGASVQWINHLPLLRDLLEEDGIKVSMGKPVMFSQAYAQVLGCDYTSLLPLHGGVDAFLIVGSVFHALGMALLTTKPTYAVDPVNQKITELGEMRDKILKRRYIEITRFKEAREIGIIISTKPGQRRIGLAKLLAALLRENGKSVNIVSADEVGENLINEYAFEAYVNTACPRLSVEDQVRFSKPMLLPAEAMVAVGKLSWEHVIDKGLIMFPWGVFGEEAKHVWEILSSGSKR